jgi:dTDP-4-dehydrorhamnose 3,5-epimerase
VIVRTTALDGVLLLVPEPHADARGSFARTYDAELFARLGLRTDFVEDSLSRNARAGTLRGLHFQRPPHAETKIVTCVAGRIADVVVDLRAGPGFGRWAAFTLDGASWEALYVPAGFAHGFQTLTDGAAVHYRITPGYVPHAAAGVRWDDGELGIAWPLPPVAISERDGALPPLREIEPLVLADSDADIP